MRSSPQGSRRHGRAPSRWDGAGERERSLPGDGGGFNKKVSQLGPAALKDSIAGSSFPACWWASPAIRSATWPPSGRLRMRGPRPARRSPYTSRMASDRRHVALYPGSFDPMTLGHLDVIERGRRLVDQVVVGVGQNPGKAQLFSASERVDMAQELIGELVRRGPQEAEVDVRSFKGLTVDFAHEVGATAILKGIRNLSDLQSEVQQAITNREVAGLETVFIVAGQSFAYTSSSLIKQIAAMGKDLSVLEAMCPPMVVEAIREKKRAGSPLLERLQQANDEDEHS